MAKQWSIGELQEAAVAIAEMNKSLGIGQKNDPASTVVTGAPAHGPGGLFSAAGYRPQMWATIPRPVNTFSGRIPLVASRYVNERLKILTGLTDSEGTRAVDWCSPGPVAGQLKTCAQVWPFGSMKIDGRVVRIPDLGQLKNYADVPVDVINLQTAQGQFIPQIPNAVINTDTGKKLIELGLTIERSTELIDFQGVSGAGSNVGDYKLWISQYPGLESIVKTGYVDNDTGVACPAADSIVVNYNALITADAGVNGASFITTVVDTAYALKWNAEVLGLTIQYAIVMNPKTWRAVAYQWACAYYTNFCAGSAGNPNMSDATAIANIRDEMLSNRVLMIDGEAWEVLLTTGIPATGNANNVFNSDIYFLPLYINGRSVLYHQFFPMDNPDIMAYMETGPANIKILNGGLYFMGHKNTPACDVIEIMAKYRLILETPFAAARINDVQYTYRAQTRDMRPGESGYVDGGVSSVGVQSIPYA